MLVWGLGKLILIYDSNGTTIEGNTDIAFREDVAARHEALGWHVQKVDSAENIAAFIEAVNNAKAEKSRPSLIVVKSVIGYGTPAAGTSAAHGTPLGSEGMDKLKAFLGYTSKDFCVPDGVAEFRQTMIERGERTEELWSQKLAAYKAQYPLMYAHSLSAVRSVRRSMPERFRKGFRLRRRRIWLQEISAGACSKW